MLSGKAGTVLGLVGLLAQALASALQEPTEDKPTAIACPDGWKAKRIKICIQSISRQVIYTKGVTHTTMSSAV